MNDYAQQLDELFESVNSIQPRINDNMCVECGQECGTDDDGRMICFHCGATNSNIVLVQTFNYSSVAVKRSIYKPPSHFRDRLREVMGKLVPEEPYKLLKIFEGQCVNSLLDVRRILRLNKLSKDNKYVYFIWETIKGAPVFQIDYPTQARIEARFNVVYRRFHNDTTKTRVNFFNYYFVLEKLMKEQGIPTYGLLFVPRVRQIVKANERSWTNYSA